MSDLGFITIPRGRRLPQIPATTTTITANNLNNNNHNHNNNNNNNLKNGYFKNFNKNGYCFSNIGGGGGGGNLKTPVIPIVNGGGGGGGHHLANGRAVHDGFATIRAGGKRGRSYSSPTVTQDTSTASQCSHGCCGPGGGRGWTMEPLWEERGEGGTPAVSRRDRPQLPWWEVATRRSRYRSCPAFSQASVVTALEQTMNSVTTTLERLASSPDLKETEAAEIRKTAAVLRQQSSAVCQSVSSGYISLERQLSCDSVSSVTSTVSATSLSSYASLGSHPLTPSLMPHCNAHHNHTSPDTLNASQGQAKLKKRSWLRSSFRRAFGRHGRKLTKQQNELGSPPSPGQRSHSILNDLPLHHTVNSAVRHLPAPPVPPHQPLHQPSHQPPPPYSASLPRKSHSSSGLLGTARRNTLLKRSALEDKEEEVRRLRDEVTEKERTLTDCRLELLSAQHQIQEHADTIGRLQAEVAVLREENLRLVGVVKGQKGTAADQVLPALTHTLTSLAISPSPINRSSSVPHENGHVMKVVVVLGGQARPSPTTHTPTHHLDPSHLTHIGNITVGCKTTWQQLDTMVVNTLKDYGNSIDPVSALGLDASALDSYQVEEVVCGPTLPRPELLPYGYCVGDVDAVLVWLKNASHKKEGEAVGSVSSSALASLTPAPSLRHLAGLLVEHRRLVLAGPPAVGKTSLAHTLAKFFVVNAGHDVTEEAVKVFRVTGNNSLDLCQLLANTWPRGMATSSILGPTTTTTTTPATHPSPASPLVLVLDDLHAAGGVVETLKRYLPSTLHSGPAIIATCCPSTALSTRLHIHCNFKWAALTPQQEPVRGLLGRVLRRRVAAAEAAANTRLPDAHHLAEWLARLWLHLNTLLAGHCGADAALGPGLLLDCPLGQEETQAWFLEVWNSRVVPHLLATMRGAAPHPPSLAQSWTDPLDWVLATYPWPNSVASGPDHLTRILVSDVLSLVNNNNNSSSNTNNSNSDSPSSSTCITTTTTTTTTTSTFQNNT